MGQKFEKSVLRILLILGSFGFIIIIKKPPVKDWLLIFFFKGYLSSILDKLLVRIGFIKYPVNLFGKYFDISFIFDYLLYPISCVYYNQLTRKSNFFGIVSKVFLFSVPMSLIEHWFEKKTQLIKFHKGWNTTKSFITMTLTFLIVRGFIALVRKANNKPVEEN